MKKIFFVTAIVFGVLVSQFSSISPAEAHGFKIISDYDFNYCAQGTVWKCKFCGKEMRLPPFNHPTKYDKSRCPGLQNFDTHKWEPIG